MTKAEKIAKLAELRAEAEALTTEYNNAIQSGKFAESVKIDADIDEKIHEYTSIARGIFFDECAETEDPMLAAVTKLRYTVIRKKDEKVGEEKVPVRTISEKEKTVDLMKLHKHCNGIGADKQWHYIAEKMNCLMTAQKCIDLGVDPKRVDDSYEMSEVAKAIDMGKTPTSKTNMLKTLQMVITAMLGEERKATSHDVNYLLSVYAKKSKKALSITVSNQKAMREHLADICHHIVTGNPYDVEFVVKK